jgi:hypothetical protein
VKIERVVRKTKSHCVSSRIYMRTGSFDFSVIWKVKYNWIIDTTIVEVFFKLTI